MLVCNMTFNENEQGYSCNFQAVADIWQNAVENLEESTLYLVAVPIGNLADISFRALAVLQNVDYIACEDTRTTALLLSHYKLSRPLFSLHAHNEKERIAYMLELLRAKKKVALVSDAGYPLFSDPGALVAKAVAENDFRIEVVPGANAALVALLGSAIDPTKFKFLGFLPRKGKERQQYLNEIAISNCTSIIYESPLRVRSLLSELMALGIENRQVCLARELSKRYESYIRLPLCQLLQLMQTKEPKGECVLIFAACSEAEREKLDKAWNLSCHDSEFDSAEFRTICEAKQINYANCLTLIQEKYHQVDEELLQRLAVNYWQGLKSKDNVKKLVALFPNYNKHELYELLIEWQTILEG